MNRSTQLSQAKKLKLRRAVTKLVRIAVMENDTMFWVWRELEKIN
jgi:hypothetical protein